MALDEITRPAWNMSVACTNPTTPASGDPVRYGTLTGVALTAEDANGNTTVAFGPGLFTLVVDDNEGSGIAEGDAIYYHDTGTGTPTVHLNNSATSMDAYFGIANGTVADNATTAISVRHIELGASLALGTGAVTTGNITNASVTVAKLDAVATGASDGLGFLRVARFTIDATAGLATGAHSLDATLPDNALVLFGNCEITTTFTDGTDDSATMALSISSANDLITATAVSSGTFWDAVKNKIMVPDALNAAGVASSIKLSGAKTVTATVAVHAMTNGYLTGWLYYVVGA